MSYVNSILVNCKFIKIIFLKQNKNLKNAVHISFKTFTTLYANIKTKEGLTTTKRKIKKFHKSISTENNIENTSFLPGVTVGAAGGPLHYTLTAGVLREE